MSSTATVRGYIAAMELLTTSRGKRYGLITVIENTGYLVDGKWKATGKNTYKLRVREKGIARAAHFQKGDEILATIYGIQVSAWKDQDGEACAALIGNVDTIAMVSPRVDRSAANPREEAKSAAAESRDKMRAERGNEPTAEPTAPAEGQDPNQPTRFEGLEGKQPGETPEQYRARQKRQGAQAARVNNANKAKRNANARRPQPTDLIMCKGPCGKAYPRRELTRAGYCPDDKRKPAAKAAAKPTAATSDKRRRELFSEPTA